MSVPDTIKTMKLIIEKHVGVVLTTVVVLTFLIIILNYLGFFTPYNYLTAQWDVALNKPRILKYGEPGFTDKQCYKIAPQFGFSYDIVAGCVVSESLINGVNSYNAVTTSYLNKKLGKNWEEKFNLSVDSMYFADQAVAIRDTVLKIDQIKQMNQFLDSVSNGQRHLSVWVLPHKNDDYNVKVGELMPDSSITVFCYYQIDLNRLNIVSAYYEKNLSKQDTKKIP
jgi:hypothetical protein